MKTNLLITLATSSLALASLTAVAGPLQRGDVPAGITWVAHVDCDTFRPTAVGQYILSELDKPDAQAKLGAFQAIFSFDLRTQLHGLTLYSTGSSSDTGVLLVYADFDTDRLVTLAKGANDYESSPHTQHTIHSWVQDKKRHGPKSRVYASVYGGRVVIFGQQESSVAAALDTLDHGVPTLSSSKLFSDLGAPNNSNFIQAAGRKLNLDSSDPSTAIFRLSKEVKLQIGEIKGRTTAVLNLETGDEDVARNVTSIAQGLLALVKLQKEKPEAVKFANAISMTQNGSGVTATIALPTTELVDMMKADAARKAKNKAEQN